MSQGNLQNAQLARPGARRQRAGVIGDPVAHSISPAMQQAAFDELKLSVTYERWQTPLSQLEVRVAGLRDAAVLGANVTVPHKQAVIPFLDEVGSGAIRARAVNTIINRDGRLLGENTDIYGFATAVTSGVPGASARTALVLGAGGAARAVVLALESAGVTEILLWNRNVARAEELAADLAPTRIRTIEPNPKALDVALAEATLVVNATSLGWRAGETPLERERINTLRNDAWVVDLTYRDTDLLDLARARGLGAMDGLSMLVHQGARAFEFWTGRQAPVETMMRAALAARAPRT